MMVDYENDDGTFEKLNLQVFLFRVITFNVDRLFHLHNIMLPLLVGYCYTPSDFRYKRNVTRFRNLI